ncbi:MAG TPA: LysR substrate-binding domain-containing protein [Bacteroidales bacterium]|mgnify:CR=1 FL=1|nr:LysR substrate-binding domain-containing protein [Bacteroidales bacterium]HPS63058.1 LysR substrate-binding domain-containing protein [Bacteroidales bacterium]
MTLQQLEYIVTLGKTRHFGQAAELCGVTQPTLSAMIRKLEEELNCTIFDRKAHPVVITPIGEEVLNQARVVVFHARQLVEHVAARKESLDGPLALALIPTVAPYLLPGFIPRFSTGYPGVALKIAEMRTESVIRELRLAGIDMAILATPLNEPDILEIPLYYEKFVAYVSPGAPMSGEEEIQLDQMPPELLWVLEEGHCLRNQVFNLCDRKTHRSTYEAGSIETLVRIVDRNGGYTVIPELHIQLLSDKQKANLRRIVRPEATREISLVIRRDYVRERLVNAVAGCIKQVVPDSMIDDRLKKFAIRL